MQSVILLEIHNERQRASIMNAMLCKCRIAFGKRGLHEECHSKQDQEINRGGRQMYEFRWYQSQNSLPLFSSALVNRT